MKTQDLEKYFDCNATTPPSKDVLAKGPQWLLDWGNPSSIHQSSRGPKMRIREARKQVADALGVSPLEIVFTSGASESNSAVVQALFRHSKEKSQKKSPTWITTQVEHPSVLKSFQALEAIGEEVHYVPVSRRGYLDIDFLRSRLSEDTALVSVMFVNNETGTIFPVQEIAQFCSDVGVPFHTDAVQAWGKVEFSLKDLGVHYASFSAHKIYALKGSGALYIRKNSPWSPFVAGGGQERGRRGGTENLLGISALGHQAQALAREGLKSMAALRNEFESLVEEQLVGVQITAQEAPRVGNTSSLVISGVDGETLLMSLDLQGFAVSTGAACSSGNPEPSPVLLSLGLSRREAQNSLRVSFGRFHQREDMLNFFEALKSTIRRLREIPRQDMDGPFNVT